MEIKTIARKWGSSLAVIIPKEIADKKQLKENSEITITVSKARPKAGILFGKFPNWNGKSTQQIKDEMREGWESHSDKKRW
jgi:hypothetical protein